MVLCKGQEGVQLALLDCKSAAGAYYRRGVLNRDEKFRFDR